MASLPIPEDDFKDLDDAALWAVIDSAAAASHSPSPATTNRKPLALLKNSNLRTPPQIINPNSPSLPSSHQHHKVSVSRTPPQYRDTHHANWDTHHRPHKKVFRPATTTDTSPPNNLLLYKHLPPPPPPQHSPHFPVNELSPYSDNPSPPHIERWPSQDNNKRAHCLSGSFPTVSLFKDYQDAAMAILEKSDYTMISGSPFIKKSGWRKIAFYFNVSFEIRDKNIEFDENRNVQRAEFIVRAYMQGGRFSDGCGSCERREKRFSKPNNDIPSTAETRAKNKACQDLLGIGEYRPGVSSNRSPL